jgi:release factor glutamine methyltransferase
MPDAAPRVRDLLTRGATRLRQAGSDTPELDAAVVLAHILGINRAALYARALDAVTEDAQDTFAAALARRAQGVPVAYLTGTKEFMGLPFIVTPAVLIPRPETELLAEWAIDWLATRRDQSTVVEVGTGSGAIAVSVAKMASHATIVASDISRDTLPIAGANARMHGVTSRIRFVRGDLLAWLGQPVDLILANAPYLTDDQTDTPELAAEPRIALAGGDRDGFGLYRLLLGQAADRVTRGGALAFEIDPSQADTARHLCTETFPDATVSVHNDLAGLARFVTVETPSSRDGRHT